MPLYDVECTKCFKVFEAFKPLKELPEGFTCECGGTARIVVKKANRDWFRPHINEHFDGTPIEVTSKKHLRELCKKYGVYCRALM
jgi:putative FmdB family regulatory protein